MNKSIQHFNEYSIKKLQSSIEKFTENPAQFAEFVATIQEEVVNLGISIISETLEEWDSLLFDFVPRKKNWIPIRKDTRTLISSLGPVAYTRRYYMNKNTQERFYAVDQILGLEKHQRITEDGKARILEEAVESCYRKGGDSVSLTVSVSKEAVKDLIHSIKFPETETAPSVKKVCEYLYIDADEDHASLQFQKQKGDLSITENGHKNNCLINKLVYVHEGRTRKSENDKRWILVNPRYFSGVYEGKENRRLWEEVYAYLERTYDLSQVKKIYLNSDGGTWIKAAKNYIPGLEHVLDEFHLEKYITKMTGHMKDSAGDAVREVRDAIKRNRRKEFVQICERLEWCTEDISTLRRIDEGKKYILSNWNAANLRLERKEHVRGCSAEGHVSHLLSSRMSTLPMGWSRRGADRMARLRAYRANGGGMLELIRSQPSEEKKAAGAEELKQLSVRAIMASERKASHKNGKYIDAVTASVSEQIRIKSVLYHHLKL